MCGLITVEGCENMLDIVMVVSLILLALMMVGLLAWAGKVADEGSERS